MQEHLSKKEQQKKTRSIDQTLEESAQAIDSLKARMAEKSAKVPKQTLLVEDRLSSIQDDIPSISEKMLAYKLRRIADSKMLEELSALVSKVSHEAEKSGSERKALASAPAPGTAKDVIDSKEEKSVTKSKNKPTKPDYKSSTFKCKSDLDLCLAASASALDKAVCYALFIRCAIKG